MKDLVSVIIGTFERFELVQRAIKSILNQSYQNIELIVVDDCSKDERYKSFIGSKDFKFIQLKHNSQLPAVPRNVGIKVASGNWISFLDDDDFFLKDKISTQMSYSNHYNFICSDAYYDENSQNRYAKGLYLDYWNRANKENTNDLDYNIISNHNLIMNSSVIVKKNVLLDIGLICENPLLRRVEDYHTWLRILSATDTKVCRFVDEPLLYYNMISEKK